jgi:diaminopimelate epimerase
LGSLMESSIHSKSSVLKVIPFAKYHGAGNDFILIDDRKLVFPIDSAFIQRVCHRRFGVGADGLLLLQSPYRMRVFNADGSEVSMCGNGIRCMAHFIDRLEGKKHLAIEVGGKVFQCTVNGNQVEVAMGKFSWGEKNRAVGPHMLHTLDTGVPHAVLFVPEVKAVDVARHGREIRGFFQPEGINVNFAQIVGDKKIHMRTYERGVEEETLACGTGAVAVAVAAKELFKLSSPITIIPPSSEELRIEIIEDEAHMSGPVTFVFGGVLHDHRNSKRD